MDRFWSKVDKSAGTDGCWLWVGCRLKTGYGKFHLNGKTVRAHRLAYEMLVGPIPRGLLVCHHCDTRLCVKPDHLFVGTDGDNARDAAKKGRFRDIAGEKNYTAKLRAADIPIIRHRLSSGQEPCRAIARDYGVSRFTIADINSGRAWKCVP